MGVGGSAGLWAPDFNLLKNTSISHFIVSLITLKALFLTALHFAFSASVPALTVTYNILINLLTTLPIAVTTKPFSQHKYCEYSFFNRIVNEWNGLPNHIRESNSIVTFKKMF